MPMAALFYTHKVVAMKGVRLRQWNARDTIQFVQYVNKANGNGRTQAGLAGG